MIRMDKILDILKTLVTLTNRQIIIVLMAVIIAIMSIAIYKQDEIIKSKDDTINSNNIRYIDNLNALQNKIDVQEKEKFKIIQEAQEYFRARFEKLEDESRRNFREVKQIKNL